MTPEEIASRLPDHFELGHRLGEGGVASVYRVFHKKLQTHWALKVLEQDRIPTDMDVSIALQEARMAAQIKHPNVAVIHDVNETDGFIFMELVDGPTLGGLLKDGINDWEQCLSIAAGIISGLAEAHRNGIVHGDISPNNVLMTKSLTPKLVDFGFARHTGHASDVVGITPGFASPEHVLGEDLTTSSDVYSIGAVIYLMTTGAHAYEFGDDFPYQYAIFSGPPRPPAFRFPEIPKTLEAVLLRALSMEKSARYESVAEMEEAFRSAVRPTGWHDRAKSLSREALVHYERGMEYYRGTSKEEMEWAQDEFEAALRHDPKLTLAHVGLADVLIFCYMSYFDRSTGQLANAEEHCRLALELDPRCYEASRSLGRICMNRRDYPAARTHFTHTITQAPGFLPGYQSLGWCEVEAHDLDAAEKVVASALEIAANDLDLLLLLTRVYYYKKEYEKSISISEEAIRANRKFGRAYYERAMASRALGQFANARRDFNRSMDYHGDPNAPVDLAILELYDGNCSSALSVLDRSRGDDNFEFLSSYYRGIAHLLSGETPKAGQCFQRAQALSMQLTVDDPLDPYPRIIASMAAAALGDHDTAEGMLTSARDLDGRDGLVAFYGACALSWSARDRASALRAEASALPRSPSPFEMQHDPHFDGRIAA